MPGKRPRQLAPALLMAVVVLALAACGGSYPNSTFNHNSDLNTAVDGLWNRLLLLGTIVFVFVEALLVFTIFKFRKRDGGPEPKQTHGHATLEIMWTVIPVLILVFIAVPTVKTIFKTQAKAVPDALQVEVIGHQWWWEFRYPQYNVITANELYLPVGRTVNFTLTTRDVLHSFWAPQLGGKRDLISNHTNYLWYTPNAGLADNVYNGFCTEYCGTSHANMRFRVYAVAKGEFESWAAHQATNSMLAPAPTMAASGAPAATTAAHTTATATPVVAAASIAAVPTTPMTAAATEPSGYVFPVEKIPAYAVPNTPIPASLTYDDGLLAQGDAARGRALISSMANMGTAGCQTCHYIRGEETATVWMVKEKEATAPNLTHFGTRHTFAGGLFAATPGNVARWIKNAPVMKPGAIMPTRGAGQYSPAMKMTLTTGLDDRQIADIVAYLMALK